MCGICGIVYHDSSAPIERDRLFAMRDALTHRGPDDAGVYESANVSLGVRRLAILDLSANGHMPMTTPDGRYSIAYNGEGYNYRELRPTLEAKGYRFRSNSDTEVLLYLYAEEGPEMLKRLNGMFAIAVWDSQERSLFLGRDRMGVKPVYYAQRNDTLYFASEQKALFAAGVDARFDSTAWEELLCFRFVAGYKTAHAGVQRLLPGHYLVWKNGQTRIHRWWNLSERAQARRAAPYHDAAAWFRETVDNAVSLRRISDVAVGVLLSGGLDSSCVAASLKALGATGTASFTVRFKEAAFDEGPLAQEVARQSGLEYHELTLDENSLFGLIHECSRLNDEPLAHANEPHLLAIAKYAKPLVTVLLSGEGADETLGGYVRYLPLRFLRELVAARPMFSGLARFVPGGTAGSVSSRIHKLDRILRFGGMDECVLFNSCDVLPPELQMLGFQPADNFDYRRQVLEEAKGLYPTEPVRQAMYLDQHTFLVSLLDRNDRTTMGASIECRVPFLDYRLVEGLAALPSSRLLPGYQSKPLLREAFSNRLSPAILQHRKWGFGVPWDGYFQRLGVFREFIVGLPDTAPVCDGPFDKQRVRRLVDNYLRGDLTHHALVRQLVFIAVWHKECVAHSPRSAVVANFS